MLTLHRRRLAAAAAICLLGFGAESLLIAADGVPAERRLPPGTSLFVSAPDVAVSHERFMKTSFGQMLQDDAFIPIREEIAEWWKEQSESAEQELGIPLTDVLHLLHGEVAFAVVQPPGKDLGAVLFLEIGDHRETLETLLEKAGETLEEQSERSVESIQDTDVTTYVFNESNQEGGSGSTSYFIKDQYFVLAMAGAANSTGILEEILIRWDGEHDSTFAEEEVYRELMLKCQGDAGDEPQLRWYFSPIDLFRSAVTLPQASQGPVSPAMVMGFLPVLGLDKFKAMGGTSTMMTDEFDSVSRTFLLVNQPTSGVLKMFEFPATAQEPPRWVPAAAAGYSSTNWNLAGAYKAIEALVDFFQPPGTLATMIDQLAQVGPRVHIKEDVINGLTGRIQTLGELRADVDLNAAAAQPMVFALEVSNEAAMVELLDRVAATLDDNLKMREFRDVKIYEAEIPNFQGPSQSMGVAVARGQLFFATDVELLEGYLRDDGAAEPLANSADYRRVASHFPGQTSVVSFGRPAAQLKPVYEMFRSGQIGAMIPQIDFSKLPEFDTVAHYFNLTGAYAVPSDGGALFVQFGLHRE
ncbi:MAG: hypothetical protein AB7U20_03645 [Planctomycetaceae bacterium]